MLRDTSIYESGHESWETSRHWKILAANFLAVVILTAFINVLVDPYGIYGTSIFPQSSFNRYSNLRDLFEKTDPKPEALIIGSSRVGCIDPEIVTELTGKTCFNWGVPAAEAEIHLAILKMALEDFDAPLDMVIVGVEPEVLHPTKRVHPQAMVLRDYTKYFIKESRLYSIIESIKRLITLEQLWSSALVVKRLAAGEEFGDWMEWREDGFPVGIIENRIPEGYQTDREEHLARQVEIFPETYFHLSEFNGFSKARMGYWEEFLSICREKGIEVYVFMPPPHPRILERLIELGAEPIFDQTREYLDSTVSEMGGVFRDYTHVESFGGNPDAFRDQVHIDPENGELMIRDLLHDR